MPEQKDTTKKVDARVCDTVDAEDITDEVHGNPENQDEEASVHPDDLPKTIEYVIECLKEKFSVSINDECSYNTYTAITTLEKYMDNIDKEDK